MGNRVSSGSTGDFVVEAFQTKDDGDSSLVSTGEAVYTSGGEYVGTYNVTVAGDYALHVRDQDDQNRTLVYMMRSRGWDLRALRLCLD